MNSDSRLDELLLRWEELQERGQTPTAEELCRDCPELAASLAERIRLLHNMGAAFGTGPTGPCPPQAEEAGIVGEAVVTQSQYRVARFHARGGLGEVWVAHDEGLHRDVALKRIQPAHGQVPDRRHRF